MHIQSTFPDLTNCITNNDDQEAQRLLKRSEERFETLVANIPGAVYRCGCKRRPQGLPLLTMTFLSKAIQDISGYPPSDFINNRVRSFASIIHPQDRARVEQVMWQSAIAKQPYVIEYRIVRVDGSIAWVCDRGQGVFSEEESSQEDWIDGVILDITERKQTEAELRCTKAFLNSVIENLPVGVLIKDTRELRVMHWNKASEELFGYSKEEVLGKNDYDFLPQDQAEYLQAKDRQGLANGKLWDIPEAPIITPHRGERVLHIKKVPLLDESSIPRYLLVICEDITERKRAEVALRESELHYRRIVETASEGVWMFDVDSKTTFANTRMAKMLGYRVEEMLGRSLFDFLDDENRAIAQAYVERRRQGIHERHDFKFRRKDGSDLWAIVSATPILDADGQFVGALRMITDITERKQAEEALRQSESQLRVKNKQLKETLRQLKETQTQLVQHEKMISLGQLVAGVAHEINNPVSFIYGNITYAREYATNLLDLVQLYTKHYPEPLPEIQEKIAELELDFLTADFPKLLKSMKEGANRIRDIVLSLRNFSRLDEAEMKQVDIHEGIDSTLLILRHRLKKCCHRPEIQVIKEYGQLPQVECYAGPLNQVFMNLLSNAIDALETQPSPRVITIRTEVVSRQPSLVSGKEQRTVDVCGVSAIAIAANAQTCPTPRVPNRLSSAAYVSPNIGSQTAQTDDFIVIRIADNGCGIPEDVKKRIFDPFFTTKPIGVGTGLGLSISHSIVVERHGGKLTCISAPDQGTEFVIELPVKQK